MKVRIFKYTLDYRANKPQSLSIPQDAEFLSAQHQGYGVSLWFKFPEVMTDEPAEERVFKLFWTGPEAEIKESDIYLGTTQDNGGLVWHVFEIKYKQ